MITEDYVSFEVAKLLKEKGFNIPVYHSIRKVYKDERPDTSIWRSDRPENYNDIEEGNNHYCSYSCPTLQMAMKWLREEHNVYIDICTLSQLSYCYRVCLVSDTTGTLYEDYACEEGERFYSYREACDFALEYCLENILEEE